MVGVGVEQARAGFGWVSSRQIWVVLSSLSRGMTGQGVARILYMRRILLKVSAALHNGTCYLSTLPISVSGARIVPYISVSCNRIRLIPMKFHNILLGCVNVAVSSSFKTTSLSVREG